MSVLKEENIEIEIKDPVVSGVYANLSIVNHSNNEFVIDFVSVMPGVPKAQVVSRVILTYQNAKRLFMALEDNLERFEKHMNEIKEENDLQMPLDLKNSAEA